MSKVGKIILVTGPSGSGKTSLMRSVMGRDKECVSVTTRPMREGEVDGVDYYFITQEQFEELDKGAKLCEKTIYSNSSYGIELDEIFEKMFPSKDVVSDVYVIVDFYGMIQLKHMFKNTVTVYIHTSEEDCVNRMKNRGDSIESVAKRASTYQDEIKHKVFYDYVVSNKQGDFEKTCKIIKAIVED